jgi:predicted phosphodiesterase
MKLRVLSDLHQEDGAFVAPKARGDVIVLAGDVDHGVKGLHWARKTFPETPIIYVLGNHEFYGHDWDRLIDDCRTVAETLKIDFLEDAATVIDGVRFLGASLWVSFDLEGMERRAAVMQVCAETQTDYIEIKSEPVLTPAKVRARHIRSRTFLQMALATPFTGKTVVVTHHLPSARSLPEKRVWYHTAYASNLDDLFGKSELWVHGHTHTACDYQAGRTRVVCNPRGRTQRGSIGGNRGFRPDLIVEI